MVQGVTVDRFAAGYSGIGYATAGVRARLDARRRRVVAGPCDAVPWDVLRETSQTQSNRDLAFVLALIEGLGLGEQYALGTEFDIDMLFSEGECVYASVSENWPMARWKPRCGSTNAKSMPWSRM